MGHPFWPLYDLRVRTPRIELKWIDDDDAVEIAAVAARGIHDPDFMPFLAPWSLAPSPELERNALQHWWKTRAAWSTADWHLPFGVRCEGQLVGVQGVGAKDFPIVRTVSSGSWIGREFQGQGIGKEMRAAMLHFAFVGLGAQIAYSGAWEDNPSSLGVSRALGYEENGDRILNRMGKPTREIDLKLTRDRWEQHRTVEAEIENLTPCLELFGLGEDLAALPAGGDEGP